MLRGGQREAVFAECCHSEQLTAHRLYTLELLTSWRSSSGRRGRLTPEASCQSPTAKRAAQSILRLREVSPTEGTIDLLSLFSVFMKLNIGNFLYKQGVLSHYNISGNSMSWPCCLHKPQWELEITSLCLSN